MSGNTVTGPDNLRMRPRPATVAPSPGHASNWTRIVCSRRSGDYTGRRRFLSGWACKEKCK